MNNVVCKGCVFFFEFETLKSCVYKAQFKSSPFESKYDVVGLRLAGDVNRKNNCKQKRIFSLRALEIKIWLKEDYRKRHLQRGGN